MAVRSTHGQISRPPRVGLSGLPVSGIRSFPSVFQDAEGQKEKSSCLISDADMASIEISLISTGT
jgi:hypothetical protein